MSSAATAANLTGAKKILLVAHEKIPSQVLKAILNSRFCSPHFGVDATSGAEALEMLKREHFDLVIADSHMPQMRGDSLAARIKQRVPKTPVILLIANTDGFDRDKCDADVVLVVPWRIIELQHALAALLA
jgi:CheY-like chemotaxis protein